MSSQAMWDNEEPIAQMRSDDNLAVPLWIEQDISPSQVAAILQGGCESGAYMPAVTYWDAKQTMNGNGDDVLQYIEDALGEVPQFKHESWSALACFYVSCAVELWASSIEEELEQALEDA